MFGFLKQEEHEPARPRAGYRGYGIKVNVPRVTDDLKLFTHIGVSERTQQKLQTYVTEHWTVRAEQLVDAILEIATADTRISHSLMKWN